MNTYLKTQRDLERRQAEVKELAAERRVLEQKLVSVGSGAALVREARALGLVKPGERLFIVKGIDAWRERTGNTARK